MSNLVKSYFEHHVGRRKDIEKGFLTMYDKRVVIDPKFVDIVLTVYDYYYDKLVHLTVTESDLIHADAVYHTKGDDGVGISWGLDTYNDLAFQIVYVCRKFSLRTYYILNLFANALLWGIPFDISSIGGYGSGPAIELRYLREFVNFMTGTYVPMYSYDQADWSRVGGADGLKPYTGGKVDLLLTSFVLKDYLSVEELPPHKYHLCLEVKGFVLDGYEIINRSVRDKNDIFVMLCNKKYTLGGKQRPRPLRISCGLTFHRFFDGKTLKESELRLLAKYAVGKVVDVGCGTYDTSDMFPGVVRYDPYEKGGGIVAVQPCSDTAIYSMSIHHMNCKDLFESLNRVKHTVLVREVDLDNTNYEVETAKHFLFADTGKGVRYWNKLEFRDYMRCMGFECEVTLSTLRLLQVYRRVGPPGEIIKWTPHVPNWKVVLDQSSVDRIHQYYHDRGVRVTACRLEGIYTQVMARRGV